MKLLGVAFPTLRAIVCVVLCHAPATNAMELSRTRFGRKVFLISHKGSASNVSACRHSPRAPRTSSAKADNDVER